MKKLKIFIVILLCNGCLPLPEGKTEEVDPDPGIKTAGIKLGNCKEVIEIGDTTLIGTYKFGLILESDEIEITRIGCDTAAYLILKPDHKFELINIPFIWEDSKSQFMDSRERIMDLKKGERRRINEKGTWERRRYIDSTYDINFTYSKEPHYIYGKHDITMPDSVPILCNDFLCDRLSTRLYYANNSLVLCGSYGCGGCNSALIFSRTINNVKTGKKVELESSEVPRLLFLLGTLADSTKKKK